MKRITYILLPLLFGIYTYRYHNLYFNLVLCLVLFFTLLNASDWFITHRMEKQKGLQTKLLILSLSLRFILALYGVVLIKKYFYPKHLKPLWLILFFFGYYLILRLFIKPNIKN